MSRRNREDRRRFSEYRPVLLLLGVMAIGLITLTSAVPPEWRGLIARQATWYGLGLVVLWLVSRVDYRWVVERAGLLLGGVTGLLALVLALGYVSGGSRRWLILGPFSLQPSEFAKLAAILLAAHWASLRPRVGGYGLAQLWQPAAAIGPLLVLVMAQPDLGTTLMIVFGATTVLLVAGIRRRLLIGLGLGSAGLAVLAWFFVLHEYQKKRVFGFLDPESDPLGIGYHTLQSKIAVGNGGVWGAGWGQGTQAKLSFLPEQHTDFIFSVWAEEWGFVGGLALLALYATLFLWIARAALEAKDTAGRLLAAGILAHFALHVGVNMAMVLGWAPVVGIPLPWMTYGGSAVLVNATAIGLVLSIRRHRHMF